MLALPACSSWCNKEPPAAKPTKPSAARVELQNPGKEPRAELEVGRWSGFRYWQIVENDSSFGTEGLPPAKAPTSSLTTQYEVVRGVADPIVRERDGAELRLIEEKGVIADVQLSSAELPAEALSALQTVFGALSGTTTKQLVSDAGEIVELQTELVGGKKPAPAIKRFLDEAFDAQRRFPFRLPPAPVGVGARWRFTDPREIKGVKATQVAEMTLMALDQETARIGIRLRLQAGTQMIPHPLDPLRQATLESFRGDGDGQLTVARMSAVVLAARLATTASLKLSTQEPGQARKSVTFTSASVLRLRGGTGTAPAAEPAADAAPDAK
jgi:hypothetical protein